MVIDDIAKLMKQNNQQGFAVVIDEDDNAAAFSTITSYKKCAFLIGFVIAEMIQNSDTNAHDMLEDVARAVYMLQTNRRHVEHREASS